MSGLADTLIVALVAGLASLGLCRAIMFLGVVDAPDGQRKLQAAPVPTSGGLGVATAALIAILIVAGFVDWRMSADVAGVLGGALAAGLIGLWDDRVDLPPMLKLVAILAIALGVALMGARPDEIAPWPGIAWRWPAPILVAGAVLWLLVTINAVNFMDGANGLAMGMALVSALGVAACGAIAGAWDIALAAGALAGGLAGFLVWNWPGRLYAGDTGALFVGAVLGGLSLSLVARRPDWLFVPPLLLLPFLSDVLLTLAWRARHGKSLFAAHRDHAYQIAIKAGLKHWQVSGIHLVWAVNAMLVGVVSAIAGGRVPLLAFLAVLGASMWVHLRVRRSGERAGLVSKEAA